VSSERHGDSLAQRLAASIPVEVDQPGLYWAAVALIVAPDPDSILLIRRSQREGDPWSGHMALPGGRQETDDPDLVATAIRETGEEVGVGLTRTHLVGALSDVAPRTPTLPPIAVRPLVFRLPGRPHLRLNQEVAAAHWLPFAELRAQWRQSVPVEVAGLERQVPAYVTPYGVVWGMTEHILADLLQRPLED